MFQEDEIISLSKTFQIYYFDKNLSFFTEYVMNGRLILRLGSFVGFILNMYIM